MITFLLWRTDWLSCGPWCDTTLQHCHTLFLFYLPFIQRCPPDKLTHTGQHCGKMPAHRLTQCSYTWKKSTKKSWEDHHKNMKPAGETADRQHSTTTHSIMMFPSLCQSEAEYPSGPCNPSTVMCSYRHSIEPTDTFKQSALFIKGCSCGKRGPRASVKAKKIKNPLRWISMFVYSNNCTSQTGEINPNRWNPATQHIRKHVYGSMNFPAQENDGHVSIISYTECCFSRVAVNDTFLWNYLSLQVVMKGNQEFKSLKAVLFWHHFGSPHYSS